MTAPMSPDSHFSREDLEAMIPKMSRASSDFYKAAFLIGNHAFLEFCGLMNEYVNMCHGTLEQGKDFTQANRHSGRVLTARDYQVAYLVEKFECIFGGIFEDPKNREVFMRKMGWKE